MAEKAPDKPQSVTAAICGDPPPGRSALDGWQPLGTLDYREGTETKEQRRERYKRKKKREAGLE